MALDQYGRMDHLGFIGQDDWLSERRGNRMGGLAGGRVTRDVE